MPTVIREGAFRVMVFGPTREHPPPHVHVFRRDGSAVVINLGDRIGDTTVRESYEMRPLDVDRAVRIVKAHHEQLLNIWRQLHGETRHD